MFGFGPLRRSKGDSPLPRLLSLSLPLLHLIEGVILFCPFSLRACELCVSVREDVRVYVPCTQVYTAVMSQRCNSWTVLSLVRFPLLLSAQDALIFFVTCPAMSELLLNIYVFSSLKILQNQGSTVLLHSHCPFINPFFFF